jgi:hypothetical protein
MLKVQKTELRVIFVALPETYDDVAHVGTFMPAPVAIPDLSAQAVRNEIGSP